MYDVIAKAARQAMSMPALRVAHQRASMAVCVQVELDIDDDRLNWIPTKRNARADACTRACRGMRYHIKHDGNYMPKNVWPGPPHVRPAA